MAGGASEELQSRIEGALISLSQIHVAYLFGSRARDKARPDSDLELALSFAPDLCAERRGELVLDAISALSATLGHLGERTDEPHASVPIDLRRS